MHIRAAQHKLCYHAKLGEEKLAFQKAPGKLEPQDAEAQAGTGQAGKLGEAFLLPKSAYSYSLFFLFC